MVYGLASGFRQTVIERRIDDAQPVFFRQERLLINNARFDVVYALHMGNVGTYSGIRQAGDPGQSIAAAAQASNRQRVAAWDNNCIGLAGRSRQNEDSVGTDQARPTGAMLNVPICER